ncbi:MAG TPA: XdhC family protein [Mycobacteriales bacterium]|nr:XdhC family protein [Mycobacteriales bacterium]
MPEEDPACAAAHTDLPDADLPDADADADAIAHGRAPAPVDGRTLIAVFASPVARHLLHFARDAGFRTVLVEPEPGRVGERDRAVAQTVLTAADPAVLHGDADVVVTDHHRAELGEMLRDALAGGPRWIGVMGNARHAGPHVEALTALGVPAADIERVHRPIGLNIGSRTPPEIAVSTLAGLLADRNDRPGGFDFPSTP